jgi:hypothetical protein
MSDEWQDAPDGHDEGDELDNPGGGEDSGISGPELDRLPPPAFPPGMRRAAVHRPVTATGSDVDDGGLGDALILPDEPIRRSETDLPDDAFISPDEPFLRKAPHSGSPEDEEEDEMEEGVVTGIGDYDGAYFPRGAGSRSKNLEALRMAEVLDELAAGLRQHGSVSLVSETRLTPFEAMLRGMIAGFLAASSEED